MGVDIGEGATVSSINIISGAGIVLVHELNEGSIVIITKVSNVIDVQVSSSLDDSVSQSVKVIQSSDIITLLDVANTLILLNLNSKLASIINEAKRESKEVVVGKLVNGISPAITDTATLDGDGDVSGVFVIFQNSLADRGDIMPTVTLTKDEEGSVLVSSEGIEVIEVDHSLNKISSNLIFIRNVTSSSLGVSNTSGIIDNEDIVIIIP
mmetsp:Transcript_40829/g.36230  ORF Transcript_40829/g.36230 Transcript_40829/m.36230 type:complete len:210 (-) Transcript_40829:483-1112(-)